MFAINWLFGTGKPADTPQQPLHTTETPPPAKSTLTSTGVGSAPSVIVESGDKDTQKKPDSPAATKGWLAWLFTPVSWLYSFLCSCCNKKSKET